MQIAKPESIHLNRPITIEDVRRYRAGSEEQRLRCRSYLRYTVQRARPAASASAEANYFAVFLAFIPVLAYVAAISARPHAHVALGLLAFVTVLTLVAGGLLWVGRQQDHARALAEAWLACLEEAESQVPGQPATARPHRSALVGSATAAVTLLRPEHARAGSAPTPRLPEP